MTMVALATSRHNSHGSAPTEEEEEEEEDEDEEEAEEEEEEEDFVVVSSMEIEMRFASSLTEKSGASFTTSGVAFCATGAADSTRAPVCLAAVLLAQ